MSMRDTTALMEQINQIGAALIDPWVVMGPDSEIIAYNRHYRALFSRAQARKLKGSHCCELLKLSVCTDEACLAQQVLASGPARYDEIAAQIEGEEAPRTVIVSAAPLEADGQRVALLLIRDVSDMVGVQHKYRTILETESRARDQLTSELSRRTRELKEANMALNRVQRELVRFRKGLFG